MAQYHRTLPTTPRDILTIPPKGPTRSDRKGWADQQKPHAHKPTIKITGNRARPTSVHQWIQAKHFVGYSASEGGLKTATTLLGSHKLHDLYAPPFEAAVGDGELQAVIDSYSPVTVSPSLHHARY